jgi:hypothetical protein
MSRRIKWLWLSPYTGETGYPLRGTVWKKGIKTRKRIASQGHSRKNNTENIKGKPGAVVAHI